MTTAQRNQQYLCDEIFFDIAAMIVHKFLATLGTDDDFTEVISVRSFEKQDTHYTISLGVGAAVRT